MFQFATVQNFLLNTLPDLKAFHVLQKIIVKSHTLPDLRNSNFCLMIYERKLDNFSKMCKVLIKSEMDRIRDVLRHSFQIFGITVKKDLHGSLKRDTRCSVLATPFERWRCMRRRLEIVSGSDNQ